MIQNALTDRDRRALSLGGVVLLVAVIMFRGVPALASWTGTERARAERLSDAVTRVRGSSRHLVSLSDSARARARRASLLDSLFLTGNGSTLAAANLAAELSDYASAEGLRVAAVQADATSDSTSVPRRIRAHATVNGQLGALVKFLMRVENGPRLLVVEELSLSQPTVTQNGQPETIHADLVIVGFAKQPATVGER
jgi:type II secretion system (T2SS) protein M